MAVVTPRPAGASLTAAAKMVAVDVQAGRFVVLLPVKSPGTAKTRLTSLSDGDRAALAAAFASDVVDACLQTPAVAAVLVVSDDAVFAATLGERGAHRCADPGRGLNAALRHAAITARGHWPELRPTALCADLPALSPVDLAAALAFADTTPDACFVQDADGTGTTLYTAPYDAFDPQFGQNSAGRHGDRATAIPGPLPTLRRDVDDVAGLKAALSLGVGPATAGALAAVSLTS